MKYNKYWFKPKRFGYGAYPTSWEGWLVVIIFLFLIISIASYHEKTNYENYLSFILELVVIGVLLAFLSAKKTDGEWKWRWGNK